MDNNVSKNTFLDKFFKLHLKFDSIAIKYSLQQQLEYAINSYQQQHNFYVLSQSLVTLIPEKIILSRSHKTNSNKVKYRCAICFPLASQWQLSPLMLAKELIQIFTSIQNCSQETSLEFELELIASGWIDLSLKESSLINWLGQLIAFLETTTTVNENNHLCNHNNLFSLQYVHARCCSLLRLGEREGLIKLKASNFAVGSWNLLASCSFSGLNSQGNFFLNDESDRTLILELVNLVDVFASSQSFNCFKLAENLSQTMLDFEANCRIFGRINPQLAQARLGLVALVQYFLALLLQQLGVIPLSEL
ncbi:DALR anticodon binding domain protein [Stanieria cyanosphaera PCC 7437]|uniref:DALR anticodon binding domain protein n=1 Tax=Stanieria cyanosphaera (strain ATCC 29371 / PCC 7437) TaxID=111780 RepID=K9XXZ7_STAC7|nr:DALR anticodon-binding domain-containing protein [Stanieria cyanosphaera]AFZ36976.1 DALR anticodon binding domain protein [Stanieria cyanosphaera PCC 7437]